MRSKVLLIAFSALILSGCQQSPASPLPTLVLDTPAADAPSGQTSGGVTASGIVVPAQEAHLGFATSGRVVKVSTVLGEQVEAGQLLVELDNAAQQRELDQAQRDLAELTSSAAIARAKLDLTKAKKAFEDAEKDYNNYVVNKDRGSILSARDYVEAAWSRYQYVLAHHNPGRSGQIQIQLAYLEYLRALHVLEELESDYETKYGTHSVPDQYTVDKMAAQYEIAKAELTEAQYYLDALLGGEIPENATGSKLTQLKNSRSRLAAAQDQLIATRILAPFSGTIAKVTVVAGENVLPGEDLVVVIDGSRFHVETTDLSEQDVSKVKVGQSASVLVKALNQNVAGHVSAISPLADRLGGDVVYEINIDLDTQPDGLLAGMSVEVNFES